MFSRFIILCLLLITSCSKSPESSLIKQENPNKELIQNWNLSSIEVGNLDFGMVDFDKQKILKIDIVNDGLEDISTPLTLNSPDFQLVVSTCSYLLIGEKCYVKISFNAKGKTGSSFVSNLIFGDTINVVTAQINRVGEVVDSVFINNGLPVSNYNFGTIEFNHLLLKSIFVKNTGTLNQTDNVTLSGSDYSLVYDACSGKTLKPQSSCLVKVLLSGQGKDGPVFNNLNYGSKTLFLIANVKAQAQVAQENSEFVFVYNNQVATGPLSFETLNLNSFKEFKVYVKNIGTRAGKVISTTFFDKLDIFYNGCNNINLNPNQLCMVRAHLNSQAKGNFSTNLSSNVDYQTNTQSVQWIVREPGDKIDCSQNILNAEVAEITWTGSAYTPCELISCNNNFHKVANTCEADILDCSDVQGTGTKSWNGIEFYNCLYNSCKSGYYLSGQSCLTQSCVPNAIDLCAISGGSGNHTCNSEGSAYGSCNLVSCSSGFYQTGNSCTPQICSPNSTASCPITNGSGLKTCNAEGSLYGSCVLSACDSNYTQIGSSCVLTNQTRACMVQPSNSNSGIESSSNGGVTWGSCSSYICNSNFTNVAG